MSEAKPNQLPDQPPAGSELGASIKRALAYAEKALLPAVNKNPFDAVHSVMIAHPELGEFVSQRMDTALNSDEQKLIAATASTVYAVSKSLRFIKNAIVTSENDVPSNQIGLRTLIIVNEDNIGPPLRIEKGRVVFPQQDHNRIYQTLQEHMTEHPELAEYVAEKMRGSVSLEEANIVGKTALLVYDVMKDIAQSSTIYLRDTKK